MTTKAEVLKTIKEFCIECSGGSRHIAWHCHIETCPLHKFRRGKDPNPNPNLSLAAKKRVEEKGKVA
jgi:hypothetical protein